MAIQLHIGRIDKGFDEVQIRIWLNYKFKDSAQLIIFQKQDRQWTAHLYSYVIGYDSITRKTIVDSNQLVKKTSDPKSG